MVDPGAKKERASRSRYASLLIDPSEDIALSCHEQPDALIAIAMSRAAHGVTEGVESAFRLLSEAAIRDRIPRDDPAVHEITEQLRIRRHPMSWIPLWPIDLEQNLRTWRLNSNKGGSIPVFEVRTSRPVQGGATHLALVDHPITVAREYQGLFDRLAPTNFRTEAWLGTCDRPIDSDLAAANELLARIEAVLRRTRNQKPQDDVFDIGEFRVNVEARTIAKNGAVVELTQKDFDLAVFLFRNLGRLLSRGHILENVWGRSPNLNTRTVDTHVSRLRSKLGLVPENGWRLVAIYQHGYRLEQLHKEDAPANASAQTA